MCRRHRYMKIEHSTMKILSRTLYAIAVMCMLACGNGHEDKASTRSFPYLQIPEMITGPEEQFSYAGKHYWKIFLDTTVTEYASDSAHVAGVSRNEFHEAFGNYAGILVRMPLEQAAENASGTIEKTIEYAYASGDSMIVGEFALAFRNFFYDPNSPVRNDEIVYAVNSIIASSEKVDPLTRSTAAHFADITSRNRIGHKAENFTVCTLDGRTVDLYSGTAEYMLLFFNNPDCNACAQITSYILESETISKALKSGKLDIMAIYVDEDIERWAEFASTLPKSWTVAYDSSCSIRNDGLYDLKAIPTIYLLDRNRTVVLKDCDITQAEYCLKKMHP